MSAKVSPSPGELALLLEELVKLLEDKEEDGLVEVFEDREELVWRDDCLARWLDNWPVREFLSAAGLMWFCCFAWVVLLWQLLCVFWTPSENLWLTKVRPSLISFYVYFVCWTEFLILNKLKRKLIQYVILLAINQGLTFVKKTCGPRRNDSFS